MSQFTKLDFSQAALCSTDDLVILLKNNRNKHLQSGDHTIEKCLRSGDFVRKVVTYIRVKNNKILPLNQNKNSKKFQ